MDERLTGIVQVTTQLVEILTTKEVLRITEDTQMTTVADRMTIEDGQKTTEGGWMTIEVHLTTVVALTQESVIAALTGVWLTLVMPTPEILA